MLYWTAASLGLAVSVSKHDPALLARLPAVEAILERAMALDESWDSGTLHEFAIVVKDCLVDSQSAAESILLGL